MSGDDTTEILIHLQYIREKQDEVASHLKELNGRTQKSEQRIAVLEDRSDRNEEATATAKVSAVKWGAGVGAALSALVAGLAQAFGTK